MRRTLWEREKPAKSLPGTQAPDTSLDTLYADIRNGRGVPGGAAVPSLGVGRPSLVEGGEGRKVGVREKEMSLEAGKVRCEGRLHEQDLYLCEQPGTFESRAHFSSF